MSHVAATVLCHHEHIRHVICHPKPCANQVVEVVKIIIIKPAEHCHKFADHCHHVVRHCHEVVRHCHEAVQNCWPGSD